MLNQVQHDRRLMARQVQHGKKQDAETCIALQSLQLRSISKFANI